MRDNIPAHLSDTWKDIINGVIDHVIAKLKINPIEPIYSDEDRKAIGKIKSDSLQTQVDKHFKAQPQDLKKLIMESDLGVFYKILNTAIDTSGSLTRLAKTIIKALLQSNIANSPINVLPSVFSGIAVLSSGHSIARKTGNNDYVSSYTLLAFISELLKSPNREALESIFYQRLEIPTFAPPIDDKTTSEVFEINDSNESIDETQVEFQTIFKPIIDVLTEWKEFVNTQMEGISSILQGKIWTRIFYSLNRSSEILRQKNLFFKIDQKNKTRDILLHEVLCISMISIINASLIEEIRYSSHNSLGESDKEILNELRNKLSNADNVISTVGNFEKNLGIVKNALSMKKTGSKSLLASGFERFANFFPLTASLIICPLIMPFLIYPLGDFDNLATLKWGSKKNYENVHLLIKTLLEGKSKTWQGTFLDENKNFIPIDMRYISVIPIASTN